MKPKYGRLKYRSKNSKGPRIYVIPPPKYTGGDIIHIRKSDSEYVVEGHYMVVDCQKVDWDKELQQYFCKHLERDETFTFVHPFLDNYMYADKVE
jgi:hypothetical protein